MIVIDSMEDREQVLVPALGDSEPIGDTEGSGVKER